MARRPESAHFPGKALLDAYGNGGFRFADMSHRGSILCLPSGIWEWDAADAAGITAESLARAMDEAADIEIFLIGTGEQHVPLPSALYDTLRSAGLRIDIMATGPAARTYNILLGDQRKVGAALIAVENV